MTNWLFTIFYAFLMFLIAAQLMLAAKVTADFQAGVGKKLRKEYLARRCGEFVVAKMNIEAAAEYLRGSHKRLGAEIDEAAAALMGETKLGDECDLGFGGGYKFAAHRQAALTGERDLPNWILMLTDEGEEDFAWRSF